VYVYIAIADDRFNNDKENIVCFMCISQDRVCESDTEQVLNLCVFNNLQVRNYRDLLVYYW